MGIAVGLFAALVAALCNGSNFIPVKQLGFKNTKQINALTYIHTHTHTHTQNKFCTHTCKKQRYEMGDGMVKKGPCVCVFFFLQFELRFCAFSNHVCLYVFFCCFFWLGIVFPIINVSWCMVIWCLRKYHSMCIPR